MGWDGMGWENTQEFYSIPPGGWSWEKKRTGRKGRRDLSQTLPLPYRASKDVHREIGIVDFILPGRSAHVYPQLHNRTALS